MSPRSNVIPKTIYPIRIVGTYIPTQELDLHTSNLKSDKTNYARDIYPSTPQSTMSHSRYILVFTCPA